MARRPKRKRTRAEIEAALKDNANVNKTPDEPEQPDERRKRKQRKSRVKRGLEKELAALSITEDYTGAPEPVPPVTVVVAQPTVEQEGKTEDDDPLEHQRRYAAAYSEGLRIAEAEAGEAAESIPSLIDRAAVDRARKAERQRSSQKERTKAKNRERTRASRTKRTDSQRAAAREADRIRKQNQRARQTALQHQKELEHNRLQHQAQRAAQSEDVRDITRQLNRDREASRRAKRTEEQRASSQFSDRVRHAVRRAFQTQEERESSQATDREQYATRREALTEEELEALREQNRIRRKAVKYRKAHANHAYFRVGNVKGQHIVNGRHKLPPTTMCRLCHAWKWPGESEFICCMRGRVRLPPLHAAPPRLLEWYPDDKFRRNIRAYNQAFAFTSTGASSSDRQFREVAQDEEVAGQGGVYTYRIQGAMGHYLGSMLPYVDRATGERTEPKFAQIYIVDPVMRERAKRRKSIYADLDNVALKDIEDMMAQCNPFAQQFLNFGEKLRADLAKGIPIMDIEYKLHAKPSQPGTHNLPTVSEVGAVVVTDGNVPKPRDLLLYARDQQLLRLFETDEKYDPLQYPLLFPYGDLGWTYTNTYAN